jgi:hypothetical protein
LLGYTSFHSDKYDPILLFLLSRYHDQPLKQEMSVREVEDRKVTVPSYDLFPTVPLTFDKVFWEAYWPIVNEPI